MVLWRAVQQKQRFALSGGHVMHTDTVDVRPAMHCRISLMIVNATISLIFVRISKVGHGRIMPAASASTSQHQVKGHRATP